MTILQSIILWENVWRTEYVFVEIKHDQIWRSFHVYWYYPKGEARATDNINIRNGKYQVKWYRFRLIL